ncbi:MAG: very short patch repair endonuclease [Desulfomonile sp.]
MREKKSIRSRAPSASSPNVRYVMQQNTGHETDAEKLLRSELHKIGLRYRKDTRPEPSLRITADIVFTKQEVCIFIDGCFWHGCPLHFKLPKTHADWWLEKIEDNRSRDERQTRKLQELGWAVLRYWEHEVLPDNYAQICSDVCQIVKAKRPR